jgi:hypothetical protein
MTRLLVTSALGKNGAGYGAVLCFDSDGELLGPFSESEHIRDPRGLCPQPGSELVFVNAGADRILALDRSGAVARESGCIEGLDPGGGIFGPDGRYYITLRGRRTVLAMPPNLDGEGVAFLPEEIVPFPRGIVFGRGDRFYLSSGIGPSGDGENTIAVFSQEGIHIL